MAYLMFAEGFLNTSTDIIRHLSQGLRFSFPLDNPAQSGWVLQDTVLGFLFISYEIIMLYGRYTDVTV